MAQAQKVLKEAGKLNLVDASGVPKKVESVIAAKTLDAVADNGKVFVLNLAGGFNITLPAVADAEGFHCKFVVGIAPTTAYTVTSAANNVHGLMASAEDAAGSAAGTAGTAVDVITFVASTALVGDYVELVCDGTSFLVSGMVNVQDAVTLA